MGTPSWGLGQTNARGLSKQDSEDRNGGLATSIIKFMQRRCMWTTKKKRKRQLHSHPEEKKYHLLKNTGQLVTLQEWILASPGLNLSFTSEGEFQDSKQKYNSNRAHPSFGRTQLEGCLSKCREYFTMEGSVRLLDKADREVEDSSLCRSQSRKIKKKVSFRIPEMADIFILDSP